MAMLPTLNPRSAASERLMRATTSGWPLTRLLLMSTAPGSCRTFAWISLATRCSVGRSSPRTKTLIGGSYGRALHELRVGHLAVDERNFGEHRADLRLDFVDPALADFLLRRLDAQVRRADLSVHADRAEDLRHFRNREDLALDTRRGRDAFLERRPWRQLDDCLELAAVFDRHELGAHHRRRAQADDEHGGGHAQRLPRIASARRPVSGDIRDRACRRRVPSVRTAGRPASASVPPAE